MAHNTLVTALQHPRDHTTTLSWISNEALLSKCQHFQENVNQTRNGVNDIRKTVNSFSKSTVNHIRK